MKGFHVVRHGHTYDNREIYKIRKVSYLYKRTLRFPHQEKRISYLYNPLQHLS